ncbi:SusC/RagA family TonB-linked outer membrane protein [Chitinophaga silvatica]|uniref:SusC/RagA family TonB-linked outer membrane protein n=1 Tax=Chitinophaga silvatica TaxID=2282649 RepID=A0A3E1Y6Z8_9BACT|nr:SusC/RagA family TonB-linked outer membrane protein [Chitinophaga silvatica]RFS20712.1 SusC/RagA family TonB-linked outer membrane protein [Chitinophaga silvatica]
MRKLLLGLLCVLFTLVTTAQTQTKTYTGKVTDNKGNPLPGATILVLKTKKGTVTSVDGQFSIQAPEGSTLVVNFTGYRTRNIIAGSESLNIKMEEDIAKLDEIVVTGLATSVKRSNAANAIATVSATELTGAAPAQTFDVALSGKITGANIVSNSGAPGGGISVKLRGISSVYGTIQPLFVIDGVPISNRAISTGLNAITNATGNNSITSTQDNATSRIADINPLDIENIEILKGASASAIYGSQASAGVVLITTKRGKAGKTKISVSQDAGINKIQRYMGIKTLYTPDELHIRVIKNGWDSLEYVNARNSNKLIDYEKEIYGNTGHSRNTNINVSGGNDKTTFLFGAGMRKETGIIRNTGYSNNNLRLNVSHRVNDRINVTWTNSYINTSSDRSLANNDNTGVSIPLTVLTTSPSVDFRPDDKGNFPDPVHGANPLQIIELMVNNEKINRFVSGANVDAIIQQSPISITKVVGRGGLDFYHQKGQVLFPANLTYEIDRESGGRNVQGNASEINTSWAGFLINTLTPNSNLTFVTTGGLTHEYGSFDNIMNIAAKLIGTQTSESQAGSVSVQQTRYAFRNDGIFAQEEFAFRDFLNFTAGVRFDKSTNNGDYKKYNIYPKANMSWNLTKMLHNNSAVLNDLKLRVAYGESSGFPTFNSRFTVLNSHNIGGLPGSKVSIGAGDPNINPERQTELEGGIDVSFFDGKVSLEATIYNKVIKDMLMANRIPMSTGYTTNWTNAATLRNRGVELGLRATPVNNEKVRWNTTLNWWKNRSKVTQMSVPDFDQGEDFGGSYGSFYIQNGRPITQIATQSSTGNWLIVGDLEPDFQLSFFNEVNFLKNFSLRALLHWKKGGDNVNLTQNVMDLGRLTPDWDEKNEKGVAKGQARLSSSRAGSYVQDASYIRIREIGLYYKVPLKSKTIQGLRLGMSLNNWFTWTKYFSYDPEASNFGAGFASGIDLAPYPSSKRMQFHLSVDL